jgi:Arm DNA-binding domain/Phage integrase, N-terminal SAM-like domain
MQKLTEAEVAALPVDGRDRIVFDTMLSGFAVRVTPAGRKIFLVQASTGGRSRKVSIGQHPDMTVADARREARSALDAIRAGKDPASEKVARLAARAAGAVTVSELADRWLAEYVMVKLKPRTARDYVQLIEQKIKPRFGHMPVSKVAKSDVVTWHVDMRATPRRANYTVATFRALMAFAEDCGLRPFHSNPRKIKMFRERPRERFLSELEIGAAADGIEQGRACRPDRRSCGRRLAPGAFQWRPQR